MTEKKAGRADWLFDLLKALLIGAGAGTALGGAACAIGALKGGAPQGLEAAKNALAIAGAAGLFLLAGMLMTKGKRPERFEAENNGWRRHFRVFGPKRVLGTATAVLLLLAALAEDLSRLL